LFVVNVVDGEQMHEIDGSNKIAEKGMIPRLA